MRQLGFVRPWRNTRRIVVWVCAWAAAALLAASCSDATPDDATVNIYASGSGTVRADFVWLADEVHVLLSVERADRDAVEPLSCNGTELSESSSESDTPSVTFTVDLPAMRELRIICTIRVRGVTGEVQFELSDATRAADGLFRPSRALEQNCKFPGAGPLGLSSEALSTPSADFACDPEIVAIGNDTATPVVVLSLGISNSSLEG